MWRGDSRGEEAAGVEVCAAPPQYCPPFFGEAMGRMGRMGRMAHCAERDERTAGGARGNRRERAWIHEPCACGDQQERFFRMAQAFDEFVARRRDFGREARLPECALRPADARFFSGLEREDQTAHRLIRGRMSAEWWVVVELGGHPDSAAQRA